MNEMQERETVKTQEKYLPIKNLSQLKRAIREGRPFRIIEHYVHPEYKGQMREPGKVQTNGFYSKVVDNPFHSLNSVNGGKGSYVSYGKASDWIFNGDGICTLVHPSGEHPIWEIGVLI